MKFIKLTSHETKAACYVNPDRISMIASSSEESATEIQMADSFGYVTETPEQVLVLIAEAEDLDTDECFSALNKLIGKGATVSAKPLPDDLFLLGAFIADFREGEICLPMAHIARLVEINWIEVLNDIGDALSAEEYLALRGVDDEVYFMLTEAGKAKVSDAVHPVDAKAAAAAEGARS